MKKALTLFSALLLAGIVAAEELPKPAPGAEDCPAEQKKRPGRERKNERIDRFVWRVFLEMSDKERKEMRQLQLKDNDAFRSKIAARVREIRKRDMEQFKKMKKLADAYQKADEKGKAEIKAKLREIVAEGYTRRLNHIRKDLENMRKRADMLDQMLKEREKNAEQHIDRQTEKMLKPGLEKK